MINQYLVRFLTNVFENRVYGFDAKDTAGPSLPALLAGEVPAAIDTKG